MDLKRKNFFLRCWVGDARLWQAYWLIGVLDFFIFLSVLTLLAQLLWRGSEDNILVNSLLLPLLISYLIYSYVSIWRCSDNTSYSIFSSLAKVAVVFSIISWILYIIEII